MAWVRIRLAAKPARDLQSLHHPTYALDWVMDVIRQWQSYDD